MKKKVKENKKLKGKIKCSKNNLIIFFIVLFAVALGIVLFFKLNSVSVPECNGINNQTELDVCYFNTAIEKADLLICDKISVEQGRDICYERIALKNNDVFVCEKIKSQTGKDNCYESMAIKRADESLCDKIVNQDKSDVCKGVIILIKIKK